MRYLIFLIPFILTAQKDGLMIVIKGTITDQSEQMLRGGVEEILTSQYQIVDVETQNLALKEQEKQQNRGCYDDRCLVKVGRMIAAKSLLAIEVMGKSGSHIVKIRKIDLEQGSTVGVYSIVHEKGLIDLKVLLDLGKTIGQRSLDLGKTETPQKEQRSYSDIWDQWRKRDRKQNYFLTTLAPGSYNRRIDFTDNRSGSNYLYGVYLGIGYGVFWNGNSYNFNNALYGVLTISGLGYDPENSTLSYLEDTRFLFALKHRPDEFISFDIGVEGRYHQESDQFDLGVRFSIGLSQDLDPVLILKWGGISAFIGYQGILDLEFTLLELTMGL